MTNLQALAKYIVCIDGLHVACEKTTTLAHTKLFDELRTQCDLQFQALDKLLNEHQLPSALDKRLVTNVFDVQMCLVRSLRTTKVPTIVEQYKKATGILRYLAHYLISTDWNIALCAGTADV